MTIDEQIRRAAVAGVSHEEIAAIFGVTLDDVRAAVAAAPERADDPNPLPKRAPRRHPVADAIHAAADANEMLKGMLRRRAGTRTADGDFGVTRRQGETDSDLYMRERARRDRGGRGVL